MFLYHFFNSFNIKNVVELIYDMGVTRGITKPTTPLSWFCFFHNFQKIQNSRQQPMSLFSSRFAIKEAQISYSGKCMICFPVAIGQFPIAIRFIFQAIRQVLVAIGQVCVAFRQVYIAIRQVFRAIRQVHVAVRQIVQLFIRWLYFSDMFLQLCFMLIIWFFRSDQSLGVAVFLFGSINRYDLITIFQGNNSFIKCQ